jgi:hypothetical protein
MTQDLMPRATTFTSSPCLIQLVCGSQTKQIASRKGLPAEKGRQQSRKAASRNLLTLLERPAETDASRNGYQQKRLPGNGCQQKRLPAETAASRNGCQQKRLLAETTNLY